MSEPNYHSTKFFTENLLAIEMRKTQIFMNKPVYLVLSILELSKIVIKIKKAIGLMKDEVEGDHERICWIKS